MGIGSVVRCSQQISVDGPAANDITCAYRLDSLLAYRMLPTTPQEKQAVTYDVLKRPTKIQCSGTVACIQLGVPVLKPEVSPELAFFPAEGHATGSLTIDFNDLIESLTHLGG